MSTLNFTTTVASKPGAAIPRTVEATLANGDLLAVTAVAVTGSVSVELSGSTYLSRQHFTPDQARAVAAELLACADALQGRV